MPRQNAFGLESGERVIKTIAIGARGPSRLIGQVFGYRDACIPLSQLAYRWCRPVIADVRHGSLDDV